MENNDTATKQLEKVLEIAKQIEHLTQKSHNYQKTKRLNDD